MSVPLILVSFYLFLSVFLDESQQMLHSLALGDSLLHTHLLLVERNLARSGTHISIVGIGHLARSVDYTTHDANLQALHVGRCSLDFGNG